MCSLASVESDISSFPAQAKVEKEDVIQLLQDNPDEMNALELLYKEHKELLDQYSLEHDLLDLKVYFTSAIGAHSSIPANWKPFISTSRLKTGYEQRPIPVIKGGLGGWRLEAEAREPELKCSTYSY
jgi:hypothetical protein